MTEVLPSQPATTAEQYEREREDFLKDTLAEAAVRLAVELNSAPKPYDIGLQNVPEDVYND